MISHICSNHKILLSLATSKLQYRITRYFPLPINPLNLQHHHLLCQRTLPANCRYCPRRQEGTPARRPRFESYAGPSLPSPLGCQHRWRLHPPSLPHSLHLHLTWQSIRHLPNQILAVPHPAPAKPSADFPSCHHSQSSYLTGHYRLRKQLDLTTRREVCQLLSSPAQSTGLSDPWLVCFVLGYPWFLNCSHLFRFQDNYSAQSLPGTAVPNNFRYVRSRRNFDDDHFDHAFI